MGDMRGGVEMTNMCVYSLVYSHVHVGRYTFLRMHIDLRLHTSCL